MAERTITTDLVGRDRMSSATSSASRGMSRLGSVAGKVGGVMKAGLAGGAAIAVGGVAALGAWVVQGVKDAASFQKVLAKTAQVLKSTGNAAGTSVEGVKSLAAELETMSGVDEELIINSQNVFATFTNIRNVGKNRIFDMATKSALDMSVALGSDLQGASIQVGKALNDPIKGVSALSKVGVTFTESQKKVIAKLVETGKTAEAQKVILAELNKEFGGQAAAAGAGFEGTMARLQDVIGDTGREVGTALLPKVTELAKWLGDKLPIAVQRFKDGWAGIGDGRDVNGLAMALKDLSTQMGAFNKQAGAAQENGVVRFVKWGVNALTTFIESFKVLGANWKLVTTRIEQWNLQIQISFQKMVNGIASAGAKLPGPMGEHFRKIRDDGRKALSELQGKMNDVNTRRARAELEIAEVRLRRLGRQKATPKVTADIRAAEAKIQRIRLKLRGIPDERVNVIIRETQGIDRARAGGAGVPHAQGGPVMPGRPYVVGDGGRPELFVPRQSGNILSHVPRGGGGDTYIIHASALTDQAVGDTVVRALKARPAGAARIPARAVGGN